MMKYFQHGRGSTPLTKLLEGPQSLPPSHNSMLMSAHQYTSIGCKKTVCLSVAISLALGNHLIHWLKDLVVFVGKIINLMI